MLGWLKRLVGFRPSAREQSLNRLRGELAVAENKIRQIKAGFDAAANNDETLGLWRKADNLSARLCNSADVRKPLRQRSRHEAGNGPHCRGITRTLANDMVGTGAALQIVHEDEALCTAIESRWDEWADEVLFDQTCWTLNLAEIVDGEGTAKLITNDELQCPVKLDVQLFECDMLATPWTRMSRDANACDGIEFDKYGRPKFYHLLKQHPGKWGYVNPNDFESVPAKNIVHWFQIDRPGQCRGIPLLTSALLIFGHLREYSAAVLQAARVAACITAIVHTKSTPETGFVSSEFTATDLEPGMMIGAPDGYDVAQMKSEQPATTYDAYERRKLGEACHACNLPYSVGTGDFSQESYAGGRMSRQLYHSGVAVRRHSFNQRVLDRVFYAWLEEAVRIEGYLPAAVRAMGRAIPHAWYYDPWEHIDETKAATAITENLANNTTTLAEECAKRKKDWRDVIRQRGKEKKALAAVGIFERPAKNAPPVDEAAHTAEYGADAGDAGEMSEPQVTDGLADKKPSTAKPATTDKKAAAAGDVQGTALNGAQITSLVLVADKLAGGDYKADAAEALVQAAFPLMDRDLISRFITSLAANPTPKVDQANAA